MEKQLKYDCTLNLKKEGSPIIIVAAVGEAEAIANACKEENIKISAICDNIKEKSESKFCGFDVVHTPSLPEIFPKARFIIASQHIQDCVEQLTLLGYDEFYSPLELLKNYKIEKYSHKISNSYLKARIAVCQKVMKCILMTKIKYI